MVNSLLDRGLWLDNLQRDPIKVCNTLKTTGIIYKRELSHSHLSEIKREPVLCTEVH